MGRVLVVDDDRAIREMLLCALEYEGYEVVAFRDGAELLGALAVIHEPCVVLMDLMMPGMDGWAVCRALAADPLAYSRHQVALMSALDMLVPLPAPARMALRKPFDLEHLLRVVATLSAAVAATCATGTPTVHVAQLAS